MSLGAFEPEGFSFTEVGRTVFLEKLEEQIDAFVEERVGDILEYLFEEDKYNTVKFEGDCAVLDVLHDGEFYVRKTPLLAMADEAWDQDTEPLQQTLETLKVVVTRLEQVLAARK